MDPAPIAWRWWLVFAVVIVACGPRYKPTDPIGGIPEACCSKADRALQHFKGCRPTGRCSAKEPFWLRGAISCGPVDAAACEGARCCEYKSRGDELYFDEPADDGPTTDDVEPSATSP
jgi:hypothetical protein